MVLWQSISGIKLWPSQIHLKVKKYCQWIMSQVRDALWKKKNGDYFQTYEGIVYLITKKSTETIFNYSSKCFEKKKKKQTTKSDRWTGNYAKFQSTRYSNYNRSHDFQFSQLKFLFRFFFLHTRERERNIFQKKCTNSICTSTELKSINAVWRVRSYDWSVLRCRSSVLRPKAKVKYCKKKN